MSLWWRKQRACPASGWGVRLGATDGRGHMVCPACEREVAAPADPRRDRVCVVASHEEGEQCR